MYTLKQFLADYPDEATCLEEIKQRRYSNYTCTCGRKNKLSPVKGRRAYACICGKQIYPLKGTIFEGTKTSLTNWFYVIYVFSQTKSGVSASQIHRELGGSYQTAWRMCHKIRELMTEDSPLTGEVEADETFFVSKPWRTTRARRESVVMFGAAERNGSVRVRVVPNVGARTIKQALEETVRTGSSLYTDGGTHYLSAQKYGYDHTRQVHWGKDFKPRANNFILSDDMATQNIENFWSHLKRGIYGVYRHVEPKYLEAYGNEFAFRYSHRRSDTALFWLLLDRL